MVSAHQPKTAPRGLSIALSSVDDGSMKHDNHASEEEVRNNRLAFLYKIGLGFEQTSLVRIDYDSDNFCRYRKTDNSSEGGSMERSHDTEPADALSTDEFERGIFLPVADCCPLIIADTIGPAFMISHIGRHSIEQRGAYNSVRYIVNQYEVPASRLWVWLGPTVGGEAYPLHAFGGMSLETVITRQLIEAGVVIGNIENCQVDTAIDERYYSHSQYLKGSRDENGRFAVAAVRRAD